MNLNSNHGQKQYNYSNTDYNNLKEQNEDPESLPYLFRVKNINDNITNNVYDNPTLKNTNK